MFLDIYHNTQIMLYLLLLYDTQINLLKLLNLLVPRKIISSCIRMTRHRF